MENKRPISIWTCQTGELQEERGTRAAPLRQPAPEHTLDTRPLRGPPFPEGCLPETSGGLGGWLRPST